MQLEIKKEKLGKSKYKLEITLKKEIFDNYREKALEKLSQKVEISGFRPGKAPKRMVIDKIGETRIESEALDMAIPELIYLAMAKEKITPIESPKVAVSQFEKDKDLILNIEVSVLPKVVLGKYSGIKIKKEKISISKEEIDKSIEDLRKRMSETKEKKNGLQKGDWAEIDFEGTIKGVKIDKLCSKNMPFVAGEIKFIPGFEERLLGMKPGEEKEFELTLTKENWDKSIAGATVKFKVKLNQLKEIIRPNLDKDFAQRLGAKDISELRERMKQAVANQKEAEIDNKYRIDLIDGVAKKTRVEIPELMINREKERLLNDLVKQLSISGSKLEDFLARNKKSKEELDRDLAIQADKNIRIGLTLAEISRQEKIEVKEAEVQAEIERLVNQGMQQGIKKSDLIKAYESVEGKRQIKNIIQNKKTIDKLVELNS